jgi:hypothetical protein
MKSLFYWFCISLGENHFPDTHFSGGKGIRGTPSRELGIRELSSAPNAEEASIATAVS